MNISNDKKVLINQDIKATEVRLISDDGEQLGIHSFRDALNMAQEASLDLVEISPNAKPPVCRLMDYGKLRYEQSKMQKKRRQKRAQLKEIKFRPVTEEGDYRVKLRNLIKFLEGGDKVKVTIRFRGRELAHQEIGMDILLRLRGDLEEFGTVEQMPKLEGRQMVMILAPKKKTTGS